MARNSRSPSETALNTATRSELGLLMAGATPEEQSEVPTPAPG
ncbi:MAG: hypothetical protein WAV05_00300 [Anaerolineales bacterium]